MKIRILKETLTELFYKNNFKKHLYNIVTRINT